MSGGPSGDVTQRINLLDYTTGKWEAVDTRAASTTEELLQINPAGDLSRFVQSGTNEVTAQVIWTSDAFSGTPFVWSIDVDEATWLVFD